MTPSSDLQNPVTGGYFSHLVLGISLQQPRQTDRQLDQGFQSQPRPVETNEVSHPATSPRALPTRPAQQHRHGPEEPPTPLRQRGHGLQTPGRRRNPARADG